MRNQIRNSGFTMIEMSIVIVIIGLMAGALVGGINFLESAKLRGQVKQLHSIEAAVSNFSNKYNCYPGDCADPSILAGFTYSGDGNGFLATTWNGDENKGFWLHLSLADLLENTLISHGGLAGMNAPLMVSGPGIINAVGSLRHGQNALIFAQSATTTAQGIIDVDDIMYIEQKIDDNLPNSGAVRSTGYTNIYPANPIFPLSTANDSGSDKCISGTAYTAAADYDDCNMVYILNRAN